ncbi:hypothetical protein chiPu_0023977, partial [Chiloscyllium punctatum]|nr:hypothetical protein [Chiloscyllium punctatum]
MSRHSVLLHSPFAEDKQLDPLPEEEEEEEVLSEIRNLPLDIFRERLKLYRSCVLSV